MSRTNKDLRNRKMKSAQTDQDYLKKAKKPKKVIKSQIYDELTEQELHEFLKR